MRLPKTKKGSWPLLKNRILLLIILATVVITFCYGVAHLLVLRFKTGDVYAPYSSLRSDPLGTRALFESLARLNGLSVWRNYEALSIFGSGRDTTFFYLGVNAGNWEFVQKDLVKPFEKIATQGGRLVFSFLPVENPPDENDRSKSRSPASAKKPGQNNSPNDVEKKTANPQPSEGQDGDQNKSSAPKKSEKIPPKKQLEDTCKCTSLSERWGVSFGYQKQDALKSNQAINVSESDGDMRLLPVSWHTLLFFENLRPPWKAIYTLDDQPVIIERAMGRGSIVFTADSFFVSNEALLLDRNPALLAWLIGPNSQVVFDEYHFGIMKTKGVAALIRTYRLHWFFVGIAFLAVLMFWKNATHFIPPPRQAPNLNQAPLASERDYTQGLISLLRRNIAVKDILTVCVAEWRKAADRGDKIAPEKISKIELLLDLQKSPSKKEINPVAGYRKICSILSEGKKL
jgi:hypothetical protein